jgi:hypothetical protein
MVEDSLRAWTLCLKTLAETIAGVCEEVNATLRSLRSLREEDLTRQSAAPAAPTASARRKTPARLPRPAATGKAGAGDAADARSRARTAGRKKRPAA